MSRDVIVPAVARSRRAVVLAAFLTAGLASVAQAEPEGRTHRPGRFDAIEIHGPASVRFVQGADERVVVEGHDDAQDAVGVELRGSRLRIGGAGSWKFWRGSPVRVVVTARELREVAISGVADFTASAPVKAGRLAITISGAGSARFERIDAEAVAFHVSGSGDGRVAGSAQELSIRVSGRSELHAENLRAERATVSISGVGDVGVWVQKELDVVVTGAGRIDYYGQPGVVRRRVAGAATINDRGAKDEATPPR